MKVYQKYQIYKDGLGRSSEIDIESFSVGGFVGISICNYYSHSSDTGDERRYTPYEVFKVKSVTKGKIDLFHWESKHVVVLEAHDHQQFSVCCNFRSGSDHFRINGPQRYIEYEWVLDEKLVSWLEKEYYTTCRSYSFLIKFYFSALDVKKVIQESAEKKEIAKKEYEAASAAEAARLARFETEKAIKKSAEKKAADEIDDIFYGKK